MGCTKEDMQAMESLTGLTSEQLQQDLGEFKETEFQEKPKENPAYEVKESKIFNKRFAPIGSIYLVVTHKTKQKIYSRAALIRALITQQEKEQICFDMWEAMKEKNKL